MDLPAPSGSGPASSPWDGDVIYRDMCGARLWRDHYEPAELAGRHHLRAQEAPVPDEPLPTEIPDTGDVVDPNADDPTPEEVTDPNHPDWVEPYTPEGDG